MYHNPVLLHPSVDGLSIKPEGIYVDATFGGGGHTKAILEQLGTGRLLAFDQDNEAVNNLPKDNRITFVNQNFRYLKNFLRLYDALPIDGLLADLGVSSHQFDEGTRGFSTRFDGPLDMRMSTGQIQTAADIVNGYGEEELAHILWQYGELKNSYCIAKKIEQTRRKKPINTTFGLIEAVSGCIPQAKKNKLLAMLFQALRIEVNQELEALKEMLTQAKEALRPGGRLVVISYHSLEDRLVKNFMKTGNFRGILQKDFFGNPISELKPVQNRAIVPDEKEIAANPRARSAKLRIAQKMAL